MIGNATKKAKALASNAIPRLPSFRRIKDKVGIKRGGSSENIAKPKPQRQAAVRQRSITDFRDVKLRAVDSELTSTLFHNSTDSDSDQSNSFVEE